MILVDANLLVYAQIKSTPEHDRAKQWLDEQLNGPAPVGLRGADRGFGRLHAASERRLVYDLRGGAAMAQQAAGMSGFDFSNAMVVITGAGAGIGQGIAQAFHAAGGRVALGDLRKDAVERAAAGLGGERTFAGAVDVRDEKSVQAFFAAAERALPAWAVQPPS